MTTRTIFPSREAIPEMVPEALWIPRDRPDLCAPRAEQHIDMTTTPREVGYAFYTGSFGLDHEKRLLEIYLDASKPTTELLEVSGVNHIGRAILRALLDPERLAPLDMVAVYHNELALARFADLGEERFFSSFIEYHGVLPRANNRVAPET